MNPLDVIPETDGVVDVTSTTLRNWYGDRTAA